MLQFHKGRNSYVIKSAHIVKSRQVNNMHDISYAYMLHLGHACLLALCIHLFIAVFVVNFKNTHYRELEGLLSCYID